MRTIKEFIKNAQTSEMREVQSRRKRYGKKDFTELAAGPKCLHLPLSSFLQKKKKTSCNNKMSQSDKEPVFKSLDLSQQQNGRLSRNQFPRETQDGNGDATVHVT